MKRMNAAKKLGIVFALGMTLLGTSAVGVTAEETEVEEAADSITLIDQLDREVTVQLPVETCYLGFYYENFLTVVGPDAFTKVKATSLYDTEGYFATLSEVYRENVDGYSDMVDVGSTMQDNFDVEKLIELDVDVAIVGAYQYNGAPEAMEKLEAAGIPVVVINYTTSSVETHSRATEILGQIFQVEDRAAEIIDIYKAGHEKIAERTAAIDEKKTTFHEFDSTISSYSEIGQSDGPTRLVGLYLAEGGADDIVNPLYDENGDTTSFVLDVEYILEQDPQAWFIIGGEAKGDNADGIHMGYGVTEEDLLASAEGMVEARPGFTEISAVKDGNIFCIENGTLRTLRDYCVVEYIAKCLYPEEFADVDPEADMAAFAEKYLPSIPMSDGIFFYNYQYEG